MKLKENYYKMTDIPLPCGPVTVESCPCFGDLTEAGFTEKTDCEGVNDGLIKDTSNGTFLTVQAVASLDPPFYACTGLDGIPQMNIDPNKANGCVSMIEGFCEPLMSNDAGVAIKVQQ